MKTLRVLLSLASVFLLASVVSASTYQEAQGLQIRKTFINQSGSALTSGTAVVINYASSNTTTGTNFNAASSLGEDITTTTTASDRNFVGVVADASCADQTPCNVVVYGPVLARVACSTSNLTYTGQQVGTSTVAGQLGSGTRAGLSLSGSISIIGSGSNDNCLKWVFVNPSPGS